MPSCDHSHLVRPSVPGQMRALQAALDDAGLTVSEIGYVNAHGTATREGDPAEVDALKTLFAEHAATLPVSATKSMHGHALGASGAIEALITVMAVQQGRIPPTAHLDEVAAAGAGGVECLECHVLDPYRPVVTSRRSPSASVT
jgi:3-oxoacyl-[acyl-carrier-protein] synthase II